VKRIVRDEREWRSLTESRLDRGINMASVTIEVPDDAFETLHRSPEELSREIRLAAAMP